MSAIVQAQANVLLNVTLGTTTWTGAGAPSPPMHIRLTTTAPTATAAGSELTGTGYTAGGTAIAFNAASSGSATGPNSGTGVISWTNGSGGTWSIVGAEIWDTAGSPLRWWFGTWTGQPISVSNLAVFQINLAGLTIQLA